MSHNHKVKGFLKGLRFISQIFENDDKDSDFQIGHPTDVKHVAHIGWDGQGHGPSESTPSWMNEFQSVPGNSSAPRNHKKGFNNSVQMASEGEEESHELHKSSQRQSNSIGNMRESHAKEKADRPKQPRKPSKHPHTNDLCNDQSMQTDDDSLVSDLPPKRSRPKISKDGSSKSRPKSHHHHSKDSNSNQDGHPRSSSKSRNKRRSFDDDGQFARGPSENILQSYPN